MNLKYLFFSICISASFVSFAQSLKNVELSGTPKEQLVNFINLSEKYEAEGNKVQQADYLNKIAYLYWENGSSKDAVEYFEQSLKLNSEIGNENGLQAIYTNIGLIYFDNKMYDNALDDFKKSLQINRKNNRRKNICGNLINIALSYGEKDNYNNAVNVLDEAYKISLELNDIRLMKTCLGMLYEYYDNLGDKDRSIEYFNKYSALDKKIQQETMSKIEQEAQMAKVEKQQTEKKLKQTFDTLKEVSALADVQKQQIDNLNLQRQLEKKEQELKERERKARNRQNLVIISSVIGVLLIILLVIFINYKRNKKVNRLLAHQNKEISDQRDVIESANRNITHSINYAKRIQKALLQPAESLKKLIPESFIFFKPRDIVSGDFYWFSETKLKSVISEAAIAEGIANNKNSDLVGDGIIISAVDCTGHGVPGAFMSMIGYNLIHEIISLGVIEPHKILNFLNIGIRNQLKQSETDNRDGMDMAMCYIDKDKNEVHFAGAKNPLVYIKNGELYQIKGDFMPIGGFYREKDDREYAKHVVKIDAPTTFYLFSDGFSDQIGGPEGRKYLSKRFREKLFELSKSPIEEQKDLLNKELENWLGSEYSQVDDILIMGFKLSPFK